MSTDTEMARQYVKFTGDFAGLKSLGYGFQKLYASNYQQWNKGDVRVWRKGSDVTLDSLTIPVFVQLVNLMIERKGDLPFEPSRMFPSTSFLRVYLNKQTNEMTLDSREYGQWLKQINAAYERNDPDFDFALWENKGFTPESLAPIQELLDRGWLEIATV